jgi:hypothetical protein
VQDTFRKLRRLSIYWAFSPTKWTGVGNLKKSSKKDETNNKIPSDSPLGQMLKYWSDNLCAEGKKEQQMITNCCFIWTQGPHLQLMVCPIQGSEGNSNSVGQIFRIPPFSITQNAVTDLLPIREFSTGGGNFVFVDAPLTSTEV